MNDKTIDIKWKKGYKNINQLYNLFDNILFVDNSSKTKQNEIYTNLLQIEKGEIVLMTEKLPVYFKHRLPEIYKLINKD